MQLRAAALAAGLWLVPALSWANPVNMERIASDDDTSGWSATADLRGGVKQGNVVKREANVGGGVQYRTFHPTLDTRRPPFLRNRWLLTTNLSLVSFGGDRVTDNGFMHTRYTRMFIPRLGAEVYLQAQYNRFTNLRSRLLTGGGARFVLVHRNPFGLWGGSGYMGEYEVNAIDVVDDSHPQETFNHRWASYLALRLDVVEDALELANTTYVQPRFDDFTDIRVLTSTQLEGAVTPTFSMGIDFDVAYDSRPPRTVKNTDLSFSGFVRFRFG